MTANNAVPHTTYSVEQVAALLNLTKLEVVNGLPEWHGPSPTGSGATKDGFILFSGGNALDRSTGATYKSTEVAELAGIAKEQYEPWIEWKRSNGHSNGAAPVTRKPGQPKLSMVPKSPAAPKPVEVKAYDLRSLEERGITRATLGEFRIRQCTRSNKEHTDYKCWEYPTFTVTGIEARMRQKLCDPNTVNGAKYFWGGGSEKRPDGYNLHNLKERIAANEGEAWLAEGEVSTWIMHQCGLACANPFGCNQNATPIFAAMKKAGCTFVHIAYDNDDAGHEWGVKALELAAEIDLPAVAHKLAGKDGFDLADLYEQCEFKQEEFLAALENLPVASESDLQQWRGMKQSEAEPEPSSHQEESDKWTKEEMVSQRVLVMLENSPVFYGDDDETYIMLDAGAHAEVYPMTSTRFKRFVTHRYHERYNRLVKDAVVTDVVGLLEGRAFHSRDKRQVWVRTAEHENEIWLDLGGDNWQMVRISENGWEVLPMTSATPIFFRRAKGMEPMPVPVHVNSDKQRQHVWDTLRGLLNAEDNENWIMLIAWLVNALRPASNDGRPFPILRVHGQMSSGKSTVSRMCRKLIDPNFTTLIGTETRDARDLAIIAKNSWVLAFDNLSRMPGWLNDALCSLVTQGGFRTRKLRSDDEETIFKAQRPIIINGINDQVGREDFLRRSLKVNLPPVTGDSKRAEAQVWESFNAIWPSVLGMLCDALSVALVRHKGVELRAGFDGMHDFGKWVAGAEPALPWEAGAFEQAYCENFQSAIESAVDASPLAQEVIGLVNACPTGIWVGTARALLHDLNQRVGEDVRRAKSWPQSEANLGQQLIRLAPHLRATGVAMTERKSNGAKLRILTKTPVPGSASAEPGLFEEEDE